MKYFISFIVLVIILGNTGCKKFVEAPLPVTQLVGAAVYNSNQTAAAAVTGILSTMAGGSAVSGGSGGISALAGLSADEFTLYPNASPLLTQVYKNEQLSTNPSTIWSNLYYFIYQANSAIEGINNSTTVTAGMKQQLIGEAQFLRAFAYFYLVNFYGDVPLTLTPGYQVNEGLARTAQASVYNQIKIDLLAAQAALSSNYVTPSGSSTTARTRPNAMAASALLARVYLYTGKYDSAELEATTVINNSNYSLVTNLDSSFLANNKEAIWQLEIPNTGYNTPDATSFLLSAHGGPSVSYPFVLSDSLEYNFESGDLRKKHWTDSIVVNSISYYFPNKYKLYHTGVAPVEYPTILRLAEVYLIRAEARANQGKLLGTTGALSDLNVIRQRAGLAASTANTQADVLAAILHERRFELFTEYGHRWFDLKRTGNVDAVMSVVTPQKGGTWQSTDALYPIPVNDILSDANLVQNPGYN